MPLKKTCTAWPLFGAIFTLLDEGQKIVRPLMPQTTGHDGVSDEAQRAFVLVGIFSWMSTKVVGRSADGSNLNRKMPPYCPKI